MSRLVATGSVVLAVWSAAILSAEDFVLTHVQLIDGISDEVRPDVTVVVRDGHIESLVEGGAAPAGLREIDLDGKFLLPGLIDAHVHVSTTAQTTKALRSGITTLRSMGVAHYADVGLRELRKRGAIQAPEVLAAGYHVRPRPDPSLFLDDPSLFDLMSGVRGDANFRQLTATNLERGVDWIKTVSTERAGLPDTDPRVQTMTEAELVTVVDEATKRGVSVASHAHGDEGGQAAVRAGVRSIEHGTYLSEETLELMAEKGTYLVPTVAVVQDLVDPGGDYNDPVLQVRGRHMLPRVMEAVATAHRLGVPIVAATDTRFLERSVLTLQHEIEMLTRCGLSNAEAIRAATSVAAELLQIGDRTGSIQSGFEADLIVVDRNPLDNILALQDVLLVVNDGELALDRLSFALER